MEGKMLFDFLNSLVGVKGNWAMVDRNMHTRFVTEIKNITTQLDEDQVVIHFKVAKMILHVKGPVVVDFKPNEENEMIWFRNPNDEHHYFGVVIPKGSPGSEERFRLIGRTFQRTT